LASGDAQPLAESESVASIPGEAPLGNILIQEDDSSKVSSVFDDENILLAFSSMQPNGDALFSDSGLVNTTPTAEGGPLGDVMLVEVMGVEIEPAKGIAVHNSFGELIGRLVPAVSPRKGDPPGRRSRLSIGWKRVKRTFCSLCYCRL